MLKFLKRWLGWEEDLDYFNPDDFKPRSRPSSATAHILANASRKPTPSRNPRPQAKSALPPKPARPQGPAAKPKRNAPAGLNLGDEPEKPQFDPYNTGKFDRSASWERISKSQR
jgi:hypothetical protein